MSYSPLTGDVEGGWGDKGPDVSYLFAERAVRQGFIRKVFALLSLQLLLTTGVTALFVLHDPTRLFVQGHPWVFFTAFGVSLLLVVVMACFQDARRRHPYNLMLLAGFTACESVLVGIVSSMYGQKAVLMAVAITAAVVVALTLFTLQTKIDFTPSTGILYTLLWVLILGGFLQFFLRLPWMHTAMAVGGALLFSVYLVVDIQLTMGNNKYAISPDEYVFATLNLYLDVINLFLYILQLVNDMQRS